MKISFQLKDNKERTTIQMHVNCGLRTINKSTGKITYQPIIISTGQTIEQKDWDRKTGQPTSVFNRKDRRLQIFLTKYENAARDGVAAVELDKKKVFNKETIKNEILLRLDDKQKTQSTSELYYMDDFIADFLKKRVENESNPINPNTLKGLKSFHKKIKEFDTQYGRIDLVSLKPQVIEKFFNTFLKNRLNYTKNTVAKNFGYFSSFMTEASKEGIQVGCKITDAMVSTERYTPDEVVLNFEELRKIYDFNPIGNDYLMRAKDIFLILAFTGQRIDEYKYIESGKIEEKVLSNTKIKYLNIVPPQTNNKKKIVTIPILPPVYEIYKKWGGFPTKIPDQKVNSLIKNICEDVGIDDRIEKTEMRVKGNKLNSIVKHELVKTHTARRSFVTNFLTLGVSDQCISQITGHRVNYKASKSFSNYVKIDGSINIAKFFNEIELCIGISKIHIPFKFTYD
jgi:integrase